MVSRATYGSGAPMYSTTAGALYASEGRNFQSAFSGRVRVRWTCEPGGGRVSERTRCSQRANTPQLASTNSHELARTCGRDGAERTAGNEASSCWLGRGSAPQVRRGAPSRSGSMGAVRTPAASASRRVKPSPLLRQREPESLFRKVRECIGVVCATFTSADGVKRPSGAGGNPWRHFSAFSELVRVLQPYHLVRTR